MNPATSESKHLALPPGVDDCIWREIPPVDVLFCEMFEKLPLPNFGTAFHCSRLKVANFDGLLAIILYQWQSPEKWFDIWVMTEYGAKSYWVKRGKTGHISLILICIDDILST
ncbi:uncharacterized protein LOC119980937 [Tripterygium wilfordii]|uniref:uncharacterized protein LOC119980937 n=1 Tax=Tripterygium wilfordii TaxID=458696 RepID=UPI0018F83968|nr:uncharacterized protein LOC119980937 [Tripterygium wilfordii]